MSALTAATATLVVLILQPAVGSARATVCEQQQKQQQQQQPCCAPEQFEASVGLVNAGANAGYSTGTRHIAYDYINQVMASNQTLLRMDGTKVFHQWQLVNFKSHRMYNLDLTTGHCATGSVPDKLQRLCVPPSFSYTSSISVGDSAGQMSGLVFQRNSRYQNSTMVMSQKQCVPVFQMSRYQEDELVVASIYNFTAGIKDRSVFKIPPGCQAAESLHMAPSTGADAADEVLMRQIRRSLDAPCTGMFSWTCWMAERGKKL